MIVVSRDGTVSSQATAPLPLAATELRIRTQYSGVSTGTDKWVMSGRFEWGGFDFPLVPGYQRVGVVEEVGSGVSDFSVGQVVFATSTTELAGVTAAWGAHTSLGNTDAAEVFDAAGLHPHAAALGISSQVGVNAAYRAQAAPGTHVLVVGDGIIGSSAALAARARGLVPLLVGRQPGRLATLAATGIAVLNSRTDSLETIADFAPQIAIDTVQSDESFGYYAALLPQGSGQVVFSGHSPDGVTSWADMAVLQKRELTAHFVSGWTRGRIELTLQLMRDGLLPVEALVTRVAVAGDDAAALMTEVAAGQLAALAAVIRWQ